MKPIMQKLGVTVAMLSIFLSASAYDFEVGGISYNITDAAAKEVEVTSGSSGGYSGDIVVPSSVTYKGEDYSVTAIGFNTFSNCSGLTSISIPNTVTTIGIRAFNKCDGLTKITLPGSVTDIEIWAFYLCSSLTDIEVAEDNQAYSSKDGILYNKSQTTLKCCPGGKTGNVIVPNTVTTIGSDSFYGCTGLTTIVIPNSVTKIGVNAFSYCNSLTTITLPNTVTTIGSGVFQNCRSLTSITIPNSVTKIEGGAFQNCSSLTTITLPNNVTTIEPRTFQNCSSLTTITLPNTVTSIGGLTFQNCTGLRSITSLAGTPPECGDRVFDEIDKQECTLYVPAGSVDAYKQASEWKDFNLVEEAGTGIDSIEAVSAAAATEVFNLAGEKVADTIDNLPAGIYIVREGMTSRKIIVR